MATGAALSIALSASPALAQKKYDTGATDPEIKIGQTLAFSGPASAYATIGKTQSHGCIRLTNWDASELANMVAAGTPVTIRR